MACYADSLESPMSRVRSIREDLVVLTKARLSFLVVVTTFVGFWIGSTGGIDWSRLLHTIFGTSLAAFGAAVFNQLMEIDADARMRRTRERPLPARRMPPALAFGIGWILCAVALIHLGRFVNLEAAALAAATIGTYIFVYTPMKTRSSLNTLVGAVSGALPPVIGWVAAAGTDAGDGRVFRPELLVQPGAVFLFGLLFFWQLPHFLAINWMYRGEYIEGGFRMWSNNDESGRLTSRLAVFFSICLGVTMLIPVASGRAGLAFLGVATLLTGAMVVLAARFVRRPEREAARTLFFYTLIYLPLVLAAVMVFWK